ncbi:MAG: hypothetical protein WAU10_03615, partial [Caldilineaceae bacterium]
MFLFFAYFTLPALFSRVFALLFLPFLHWTHVWNEQEGEVSFLNDHTRPITALTLSMDASYLSSAGEGGEIHIWDMSTMKRVKTLWSLKSNVTHISMG